MYRAFVCLTEQHTGWVVPLAALICWGSVHTSLRLVEQSRSSPDGSQWLWLAAAGFSAGSGVWSTHFIGMLGYDPGVVLGYDPRWTLVSFGVAVIVAMATLTVLRLTTRRGYAVTAGACFGLGIGAMHYSGMAGVEVPGSLSWDTPFVLASLLIGPLLAALAFAVFARRNARARIESAATILTLAIAGLHFTAMAAVDIVPSLWADVPFAAMPHRLLAFGIAAIMLTVLGFAVLALFADRMRQSNRALRASEQRFRLLAETTTDVIIWSDLETRRKYVSPAVRAVLGYEPEELVGTSPLDSVHPDDADAYRQSLENLTSGRVEQFVTCQRYRRKDGAYTWVEISFSLTRDAASHRPNGYVASLRDIAARKEAELKIAHMAMHDALTGLPNRLLFRDRLNQELANAKRYGGGFAVLACDLDRFKLVNDTHGHPAGDRLLCEVANRLTSAIREVDTVARLGGDEFAVILSWLYEPQAVGVVVERVIDALLPPFDLDGVVASIGVSIGVALGTAETADVDALFKNADIALYRAKSGGGNGYSFYEPGMDGVVADRNALEQDLRGALRDGDFVLHYQPIVNLLTDEPGGFEALLRWRHPTRGMVSPGEFIPLAEETGLIVPLGSWALHEACREAVTWPGDLRVAVNVSAIQFHKAGLEEVVIHALAASGLAPERLELEITESILVSQTETVILGLQRLRTLGIRVAMDDFGTGYSSLSYLRRFPFDKIKIDRSFVHDIANPDTAAIVRAIVGIGARLGAAITAEGVETEEQLRKVREEGCTEVQGYLFSRPLSQADTHRYLERRTRAAA